MLKKGRGETGSRFLRDIASAPPMSRKEVLQSVKETQKCEYLEIEELGVPIKIMAPNLLLNKQKRLLANRGKKRAVTAGFSRSHLVQYTTAPDYTQIDKSTLPELTKIDKLESTISKPTNSSSPQSANRNHEDLQFIKDSRRKASIIVSDQSFLTDNGSFSESFQSRSSSLKQRKRSLIPGSRMNFAKTRLNNESPYSPNSDASGEDRAVRLKKTKLKAILKVLVEPLELELKQKEENLVDAVLKRFKYNGIPIDKKVLEKGILHPVPLMKKDITESKKVFDRDTPKPGESALKKKKRELKKRSESTKLLHITALVVEPKDSNKVHANNDVLSKFAKSAIKPKTNTWWTKAEYQAFHDNIQNYRQSKKIEKEEYITHKEPSFRYTGIASASKNGSSINYKYIERNSTHINDQSDMKKPIWHERLARLDDGKSKTPESLFGKSKMFSQDSWKQLTNERRIPPAFISRHIFSETPTTSLANKLKTADYIEVAFI